MAEYKADRGAFFSDAKSKLDRHLESLASAGAKRFPPIMIGAIENDAFNDDPCSYFEITPVKIRRNERNVIKSKPDTMITNKDRKTIINRREKLGVKQGLNSFPH